MLSFLNKYSPLFIIFISLLVSSIFRIMLPWDTVFTPNGVLFQGVDAYYYLHIADIVSQNNMALPMFDSYFDFPIGFSYSGLASSFNAYGYFTALIPWVFTLGHVTKQSIDSSAAVHPAILGILSLIPLFVITYLLTKNKWIASGAILLGSVMPGEYMGRAMLGSCDTHCLEIFLFSYLMMFTVMSLTSDKMRFIYAFISGLLTTAYFVIWQGAIVYVILLTGFACLWLIWSRIKYQVDYKSLITSSCILAIASISYALTSPQLTNLITLIAPLGIMLLMLIYTYITKTFSNWAYLLPIGVVALIMIGCVISLKFVGYFFYPEWFNYIVRNIYNLVVWHTQSTTAEELPLLVTLGTVSPEVPLAYFSVAFYLTFIGIGMILYKWQKHNKMNIFLLLVWTILLLIPTLAMRRFSYYFAMNVIILSVIVIWDLIKFNWVKK